MTPIQLLQLSNVLTLMLFSYIEKRIRISFKYELISCDSFRLRDTVNLAMFNSLLHLEVQFREQSK